jgi:hypothetical protein
MKTTKLKIIAIGIAGSLLATTQCFAICDYPPGVPRHQTPVPTGTVSASPIPTAPQPVPAGVPVAVPTYSAASSSTGPLGNAVGNGSMSAGVGAGGAMVATSARAGTDRASYCRRDGRSKAMIDACLKVATGR